MELADSFLVFIIDLDFKDYSLSRVSARPGQDHYNLDEKFRTQAFGFKELEPFKNRKEK
jgi:hypothetical protein